jgi:hypothetical protein
MARFDEFSTRLSAIETLLKGQGGALPPIGGAGSGKSEKEVASSSSSSMWDPLSEEDKMLMGTLMLNTSNDGTESKRRFDILKSLPPDQRRCITATAQGSLGVSGNDIKILPELLEKVDWISSISLTSIALNESLESLFARCKNLSSVDIFHCITRLCSEI